MRMRSSVLGFVGLVVVVACAPASIEAVKDLHGDLRQLLQDGSNSCGSIEDNIDYPSGSTLNNGQQDITNSNEECCNLCNRNPGCKSWTRIKQETRWNRWGECWLRDHVPGSKSCGHCASGVKKSADDVLDKCEADGTFSGTFAYRAACSTLINKCPPPPIQAKKISRSAAAPAYEGKLSKSVTDALDKSCKTLFKNNCIRSGMNTAVQKGGDCSRILEQGPHPEFPAPDCPDFGAAIGIMEKELTAICKSD